MVELPLLPVFDAQVCPVALGHVDLVGLDGVQQLLLLGQVALKEELDEHRHSGLVQLDNLNRIIVKKWGGGNHAHQTVLEVKDNLGFGAVSGSALERGVVKFHS